MPKVNDRPKSIRPYIHHGLILDEKGDEAVGDCPFCGRESKFSVNLTTGLWRCLICSTGSEKGGGNSITFLRELWKLQDEATKDYSEIAASRGLLFPDTAMHWGLTLGYIPGEWLVPGYNHQGMLRQLYRYTDGTGSGGKRLLLATSELEQHLHRPNNFTGKKSTIYVCEGYGDGMVFWETLRITKLVDGEVMLTSTDELSLAADADVVAVPGCNVWVEEWNRLFAGKRVVFLYDNDHPRTVNERTIEGAGYAGMKRAITSLASSEEPPKEISYLHWGPDGYNIDLPSGYDVRDFIREGGDASDAETPLERCHNLARLLDHIEPIPPEWIAGRSRNAVKGGVEIEIIPCHNFSELYKQWQKGLKTTEGLKRSLICMLATIVSTEGSNDDQLWMRIIGPPSCGKTTLCDAVSVCREYVTPKSVITGFHSGWRVDGGATDVSLVAKLAGKTLVTKDGDTLVQSPQVGVILSQARDIYDRTSSSHYGHGIAREYNQSMTWILCGTGHLRVLDKSELGERFLSCNVMEAIDEDFEDEVAERIAFRTLNNFQSLGSDEKLIKSTDDLLLAKQMTGGYVKYLRDNDKALFSQITCEDEWVRKCAHYGKFVSFMRARPSDKQDETAEREFSGRLVAQLVRLAICTAVVINETEINERVMEIVRQVTMDTAKGKVLTLSRHLHNNKIDGMGYGEIDMLGIETGEKLKNLVRFLRRIGMIEAHYKPVVNVKSGKSLGKGKASYKLSGRVERLFEEVMVGE